MLFRSNLQLLFLRLKMNFFISLCVMSFTINTNYDCRQKHINKIIMDFENFEIDINAGRNEDFFYCFDSCLNFYLR